MKIKSLGKALIAAQQIFKNKDKIKDLFNDSSAKAGENKDKMGAGLWGDVKILRQMLQARMKGSYKFSKRTVLYVIAGLLYFVNPLDLVPDFILGLGFLDDAAVLALVLRRVKGDVDKFKEETDFQDVEVL